MKTERSILVGLLITALMPFFIITTTAYLILGAITKGKLKP